MKTRVCLFIVLLIGTLVLGARGRSNGQTETSPNGDRNSGYFGLTVAQAEQLDRRIRDTVRERGVLESAGTLEIRNQLDGTAMILFVVLDGTMAKKGDLLVEFDSSSLQEELVKQEVALVVAQAGLQKAKRTIMAMKEMEKSQLVAADLTLKVATLARDAYLAEGGKLEFDTDKAERNIAIAEQKHQLATKELKRVELAAEEHDADDDDLEETRIAVLEADAALDTARGVLRLLVDRTSKYRTAVLELAVVEAESVLPGIQHQSKAAIIEAEAEIYSSQAAIKLEETRLVRIRQQVQRCRVEAPRDGIVVLANTGASRLAVTVEEGATLRPRQPILKMPDMEHLQLRLRVHETHVHRVHPGQSATFRFDAFPDREFHGSVTAINDVPEPTRSSWIGLGDVKEYAATVSIKNPIDELRLGLTALVEIDVSASVRQD